MGKINHLFVIDPIESLNIKLDSSLRMARALRNIGHEVSICEPSKIEWLSREACASAVVQDLRFDQGDISSFRLSPPQRRRLDSFRAIHMRKDPPYDMNYIACTWLLESAAKQGVTLFNDARALRDFNEKLGIFRFPDAIRDGLVSAQNDALLSFLDGPAKGDAILKPLTLFGGRGVLRLNRQLMSDDQINHILAEETHHGEDLRLIQAFDSKIFEGEVRAFSAGGEALAWCVKRPLGDNFLANTRSGATLEAYTPTSQERAMIGSIARELLKEGVFFIGFDIIGGHVSEINITSPRLLHGPQDMRDYYQDIAARVADTLG